MSKNNPGGRFIVAANNLVNAHPLNPGYGREVDRVELTPHGIHVTLVQPAVIEGEYEVQPNLTDLMDDRE